VKYRFSPPRMNVRNRRGSAVTVGAISPASATIHQKLWQKLEEQGGADFVPFKVCGAWHGKRPLFVNMWLRRSKPGTEGRGRGKAADSLRCESLRDRAAAEIVVIFRAGDGHTACVEGLSVGSTARMDRMSIVDPGYLPPSSPE
jgi:hypothetical protein